MQSVTFDGHRLLEARMPRFDRSAKALEALRSLTSVAIRRCSRGRALSQDDPNALPREDRYLTAIGDYRDFIAAHPDMPRDHRDRFLGEIIRFCEEARSNA